jgi:hypothetical protein
MSWVRRDESCHKKFFLPTKGCLNELYTLTAIKLSNVILDVYQSRDKSFTKRIITQGRRKGGGAGGHRPPCPLVRRAGGGESALRVKILTQKI